MREIEKVYAYFRVQVEGKFNMNSYEAMEATGLSEEDYLDIKNNYSEYRDKYQYLYDSLSESAEFSKCNGYDRSLSIGEKANLVYYSGFLYALARTKSQKVLTENQLQMLTNLKVLLDAILKCEK